MSENDFSKSDDKNMQEYSVITNVVNKNLCVGCGMCVAQNKGVGLKMSVNEYGFIEPVQVLPPDKLLDEESLKVCPFNTHPAPEVRTENELSEIFLQNAPNHSPKIGKYHNTYVGFAPNFRATSSSGGLATYIICKLFEKGVIDAAFVVKESAEHSSFYEYTAVYSSKEAKGASKTRYYPVTLSEVMQQIEHTQGRVAIVAVSCFIKAIRLCQHHNPEMNKKIVFLTGIICGGLKSRFFAEYLASKAGVSFNEFKKPDFRVKNENGKADDYAFACLDKNNESRLVRMKTVGDMWGTGLFKHNACDFCDDVTAELADISLGDAWIEPYSSDGKGNSAVATRSQMAENLIREGILDGSLQMNELPLPQFILTQYGGFNHKHKSLEYRIKIMQRKGIAIPPKRFIEEKTPIEFQYVQKQRMKVRKKSLEYWAQVKDAAIFDKKMAKHLLLLRILTKIYHILRNMKSKRK